MVSPVVSTAVARPPSHADVVPPVILYGCSVGVGVFLGSLLGRKLAKSTGASVGGGIAGGLIGMWGGGQINKLVNGGKSLFGLGNTTTLAAQRLNYHMAQAVKWALENGWLVHVPFKVNDNVLIHRYATRQDLGFANPMDIPTAYDYLIQAARSGAHGLQWLLPHQRAVVVVPSDFANAAQSASAPTGTA